MCSRRVCVRHLRALRAVLAHEGLLPAGEATQDLRIEIQLYYHGTCRNSYVCIMHVEFGVAIGVAGYM